jgi:hypothetical protein
MPLPLVVFFKVENDLVLLDHAVFFSCDFAEIGIVILKFLEIVLELSVSILEPSIFGLQVKQLSFEMKIANQTVGRKQVPAEKKDSDSDSNKIGEEIFSFWGHRSGQSQGFAIR